MRSAVASASRSLPHARAPISISRRAYAKAAKSQPSTVVNPTLEDYELPDIHLGHDHPNRYRQYYDEVLSEDLLYMTYDHRIANRKAKPPTPPEPLTPFEANQRGKRLHLIPKARTITHATIPELQSIIIHCMAKDAIGNKQQLLNPIMAWRAITGEAPGGGGRSASQGVQVIKAKTGAAAWKLREDMPIAVKVELKGDAMYDFIQSLVDFVLPRLREYPGAKLAAYPGTIKKSNMVGPVISFGLPPAAMGLFPQIEGNIDSYPKLHGFHMYFKTNLKGDHAEMWGRNLLSGFRIPFYRE